MEPASGPAMRAPVRAKNKAPAPMQITAEQILREAAERQEQETTAPKQRITDPEELAAFRLRQRKGFEDALRLNRQNVGHWLKYAKFEESQGEFDRARSVLERALELDHRSRRVWLAYAEMEMRNRHVNAARNVWDRAVTLLPREDVLWFRYAYMEEMLGNVQGARSVFQRWTQWEPGDHAWTSFVRFEMRHNNVDAARRVYESYVACHPLPRAYIRWAKFEERLGETQRAREVFEHAFEDVREDLVSGELFTAFGEFEERQAEYARARLIYKHAIALERLPDDDRAALRARYVTFEKSHGDRRAIEDVVTHKKRDEYELKVTEEPHQYDHWFDYARLEESLGAANADRVREVYARAVANVPPAPEKRLWRRYIYLWLKCAIFEELVTRDYAKARDVLTQCLRLIPHDRFTFGKIWIHLAHFELRRGQLSAARKVLGNAIGRAPKDKVFRAYIDLEWNLAEVDRCRMLYEKYVAWAPYRAGAWIAMAQLEARLEEYERARAVFEIAVSQPELDMPELVWKAFIDMEASIEGSHERVRTLYRRLLGRTKHVKVWLSLAKWEAESAGHVAASNAFREAHDHFKEEGQKLERLAVLEAWQESAQQAGDTAEANEVAALKPQRIKKKRALIADDGTDGGWEEYFDYIYPEERKAQPGLKILELAHRWKRQRADDACPGTTGTAGSAAAADRDADPSRTNGAGAAPAIVTCGDEDDVG